MKYLLLATAVMVGTMLLIGFTLKKHDQTVYDRGFNDGLRYGITGINPTVMLSTNTPFVNQIVPANQPK